MYTSTNQQKGRNMRAIYVRRRIMVAIAPFLIVGALVAVAKFVSQPTFTCTAAEITLVKGDKIWSIADRFCEGNITDAAGKIMDDNGIEGKDLDSLRPGTIIIIKEGN